MTYIQTVSLTPAQLLRERRMPERSWIRMHQLGGAKHPEKKSNSHNRSQIAQREVRAHIAGTSKAENS